MRRYEALEPVASRVAVGGEGGGRLLIACTGKGVAFMVASSDRFLAAVGLLDPPSGAPLLDELAVGLGAEGFRPSDPLLLVQVTDFACSGFVAGKLLFRCALLLLSFLVFNCLPDLG